MNVELMRNWECLQQNTSRRLRSYAGINKIRNRVGTMRSPDQVDYTTGDGSNSSSASGESRGSFFVRRS